MDDGVYSFGWFGSEHIKVCLGLSRSNNDTGSLMPRENN